MKFYQRTDKHTNNISEKKRKARIDTLKRDTYETDIYNDETERVKKKKKLAMLYEKQNGQILENLNLNFHCKRWKIGKNI